jgi:hypothetical protein
LAREALPVTCEAAQTYRSLAEHDLRGYLEDFAGTLALLAVRLQKVGRTEEAAALYQVVKTHAVEVYAGAASWPAYHDLAVALARVCG